jgi:Gram-negative bacterial TonB protein C-terminal
LQRLLYVAGKEGVARVITEALLAGLGMMAQAVPSGGTSPAPFPLLINAPDGLPVVQPIELPNCALEIKTKNDAPGALPTKVKYLDNGIVRIERSLPEADSQRKTLDLLVRLDTTWYAQGRASVYRVSAPDNDPAKLSGPMLGLPFETDFADALAKAKEMSFWEDQVALESFDLKHIDRSKFESWKTCITGLEIKLAPTDTYAPVPTRYRPQAPLQPLTARNRQSWITTDDYPSRALRDELEGTVAYTLEVNVNGLVRDCTLTPPSNVTTLTAVQNDVPILNEATCRNIKRRARFVPATDGSGRPMTSFTSGRVHWVIPYDPPAPPISPVLPKRN